MSSELQEATPPTTVAASPSVNLRFATSSDEDINGIVDLGREVFLTTFAHTVSEKDMDSFLEANYSYKPIKADLDNPNRRCIVAESAEPDATGKKQIIGYSFMATDSTEDCLKDYPNAIELLRIYTHPSTHGKGLAKQIADASFDLGRKEGYDWIWLGVYPENHRAIAFYQKKLGFKKIGTHAFWVGDQKDEDDVMICSLKQS
ncbi:hypothetical protein OC846_000556 [Tilletia horrida]|uniref:N-acetyltransferase domain-containing protein n=1 Tax=Tilletia horrida TaxID=155126 RepID=A0AAN6GVR3_9BASI|nr:hypothetical protein OC846_000556 [Tilletia horrida]KAK0569646.1 hypothetical protein OC861_000728 [Tilletia horrida]